MVVAHDPAPLETHYMYWPEVIRRVGMSRRQIERMEAAGLFPTRVRVGRQKTGFYRKEVWAWLDSRARVR